MKIRLTSRFLSLLPLAALTTYVVSPSVAAKPIDRYALVTRHDVVLHRFDPRNPLTVGNGGFAFTVDATGLQTFFSAFTNTIPLGTLSDWGWHAFPNPHDWSINTFHFTDYPDLHGRLVPYADVPGNKMTPEIKWLRQNPHRLDLGQIGFVLQQTNGLPAQPDDLTDVRQKLNLWDGIILSHFRFEGEPVDVQTLCDPHLDAIAVRVVSPLFKQRRLAIQIHFPYGTPSAVTADWSHPNAYTTTLTQRQLNQAAFHCHLNSTIYHAAAAWTQGATLTRVAKHQFLIGPGPGAPMNEMELVCGFAATNLAPASLPTFAQVKVAAEKHWNKFWSAGGAIDLAGSKDPRWFELERRIVLSEYLTAIQDAGCYPPQETGLTYNSWNGKFHLEMQFWHEAQFALWDRLPLLKKSLGWYKTILPRAEATARKQGYAGARWPKMTSPGGAESPSPIGPFLVWQEPHPIFYAELCYRAHPDRATLEWFKDIVFQTADFMASYAAWDAKAKCYVLGPTLECAQEIFPKGHTLNPTFELTYWRWGLETAQKWRERLGLAPDKKWQDVLDHLAKPSVSDGKYLFAQTAPDCYISPYWRRDHPAVLMALSFLPGPGINHKIMRNTFKWIWHHWNWPTTWGWDYPMMAMTAARLGEPKLAVDALLRNTPKNHWALNGQVYQRPGLTIYLPANGGLLYATAMMAAGWDGAPKHYAPGFPDNGQWHVRWEDLRRAP